MDNSRIERWRRSIAMLPPGHASGALSKAEAEALLDELARLDRVTGHYRALVDELRALLDASDIDERSDPR